MKLKHAGILAIILFVTACSYDKYEELHPKEKTQRDTSSTNPTVTCDTISQKYSADIKPIIIAHCETGNNSCHGSSPDQSGISLSGYAGLRDAALSGTLIPAITHTGGNPMPRNASKLEDCLIAKIKSWANAGAQNN